jgi:hypothetical protein
LAFLIGDGRKVCGKRISAHGHRYYERRENRSDKEKYLWCGYRIRIRIRR